MTTFILTAVDDKLADAFERHCSDMLDVEIHRGSIFDVECDAVVSPANSFGFMDGGIDSWYCWRFGDHVQDKLRMAILKYWHGELPIGVAEIVETNDKDIPYLIAAPTMRVPMILDETSINAYQAMRAVIMTIRNGLFRDGVHKGMAVSSIVKRVALPGLGTGVGKIDPDRAAHQMKSAIALHRNGDHFLPIAWSFASEAHQYLLQSIPKNLQR